jgi:hypothetical protein
VNIAVFHIHRWASDGSHAIASPGVAPDDRVILWYGLPPAAIDDMPGIAPIVSAGHIDHRMAYAERVPPGVPMTRVALTPGAQATVATKVRAAIDTLHRQGLVHGSLRDDRIWLGVHGEVVIFGRGRRGMSPGDDLSAFEQLFSNNNADPDDTLAAIVRGAADPTPTPPAEMVALTIGLADAADEVVPDIGPDRGHDGLLDRWGDTSTGRGDTNEPTPEITADGRGPTARLREQFWGDVSRLLQTAPAPNRFADVDGQPSRAIRAILAEEHPDLVPGWLTPPELPRPPENEDERTVIRRISPEEAAAPPVERPRRGGTIAIALLFGAVCVAIALILLAFAIIVP